MIYNKNGVVIRESRDEDVDSLKERLRDADLKEVIAGGNIDGFDALQQSRALSDVCYTVDIDGIPACMFGVVREGPILGRTGRVWMLGAPELGRIKKTFVKLSRQVLRHFLTEFPVLFNFVDSRYVSSIVWLKSCGAVFSPEPLTLNGVDFYGFVLRRA